MKTFTNPLDKIRIASPCAADWGKMYGDDRKRFCSECKLNVYNLSAMTKAEAERLLINSEGRLCVRFYRRTDGTVLTENCPVGWERVKQRVSLIATATFSMMVSFFGGILAFNISKVFQLADIDMSFPKSAIQVEKIFQNEKSKKGPSFGGAISNLNDINNKILKSRKSKQVSST